MKILIKLHLWFASLLAATIPTLAQTLEGQLPAGEGKDVVERVCSPCHGVYPLTQRNRSREAWLATISTMQANGAQGTRSDFQTVADYLTKYVGVEVSDTIRINRAGVHSLTNFFKLFPEEADAIIKYRDQNGPFKQWEDLKKVPGIDPGKLESKKDKIDFT